MFPASSKHRPLILEYVFKLCSKFLPLTRFQSYWQQLVQLRLPCCPTRIIHGTQISMKLARWKHSHLMTKCTCGTSFHTPPSGTLTVNAYSNYGCVNWCGRSFISHVQPPTHCLQVDLATSQGLCVPSDIVPTSLPVGARNTPSTELQCFMDVDRNSMSVTVS